MSIESQQLAWELLTKEEVGHWAWIAGIIDGEGCITIEHQKNSRAGVLLLRVRMTHKETLDRVQILSHIGVVRLGNQYDSTREKLTNRLFNRKPIYRWAIGGANAASVLRQCLPFLVTKQRQAQLAILYAELTKLTSRSGGIGPCIPCSPAARRLEIAEEIHKLNSRGRVDDDHWIGWTPLPETVECEQTAPDRHYEAAHVPKGGDK